MKKKKLLINQKQKLYSIYRVNTLLSITIVHSLNNGLLTESLLAQHRITWFTRITLSCGIDSSDAEGVLLLLHQTLQEMLQDVNAISNTDPLLGSALEELNDVGLNLSSTIMLRFGPLKEGRCLGNIFNCGLAWRPRRI